MNIIDNIAADTIEIGDQIIIQGEPVEVFRVSESTDDPDEIIIEGFSHETGDREVYSLYAHDYFDMWSA